MDKTEMAELLNRELPADASQAKLAEYVRDQHKLILSLLQSIAAQGASILDIREKMVDHKAAIEAIANYIAPNDKPSSGLIGFDKQLSVPRKVN